MKKLNNEPELVKEAIRVGGIYANNRQLGKIEEGDSANAKAEFIYRLLVHDKLIQPLAKTDTSIPNMKHKLALWISRQLPEEHPLLKQ